MGYKFLHVTLKGRMNTVGVFCFASAIILPSINRQWWPCGEEWFKSWATRSLTLEENLTLLCEHFSIISWLVDQLSALLTNLKYSRISIATSCIIQRKGRKSANFSDGETVDYSWTKAPSCCDPPRGIEPRISRVRLLLGCFKCYHHYPFSPRPVSVMTRKCSFAA